MSGLVFVRDAQGRSLMPMSAAYARTLVHQGKAQVLLHPAVSTIQLTRTVTTPTLRPVVMGLALNATTVDIIVVVEQARSAPISLHLVVDLRMLASRTGIPHARTLHLQSSRRYSHARFLCALWRYASILTTVIAVCRQLVPISHLVLLPSPRGNALPAIRAHWIRRHLQRRAENITVIQEDGFTAGQLPRSLMQVLTTNLLSVTTQPPNLVVCVTGTRWKAFHQQIKGGGRHEPHQPHMVKIPSNQRTYGSRLGTTRQAGHRTTGIIQGLGQAYHLMLWVPTDVHDQGVQWETIPIPNPATLHVWPSTPILMMPLSNARHCPERLP